MAYLSPMDASAAIRTGSIDAWSTWQPYAGLQVAMGDARVLANGTNVARGASFLVSSTQALASKSGEIGDFARRLRRAQQWGAAHTDAYAALYASATGVPLPIAQRVAKALVDTPIPMDAKLQAIKRGVMELFVQAKIIPALPNIAGVFDNRFENASIPTDFVK